MSQSMRQSGFALVLVIWVLSLLTALISGFAYLTRGEARLALNKLELVRSEALADAGAELALIDLRRTRSIDGYRSRFTSTAGPPVTCEVPGQGVLVIDVGDESGRIDLNSAGIPILEALFAGLGERERAASLAAALYDYRDTDDDRRPNGAESNEYLAAGLAWHPRNAPLGAVEELSQVLGFDSEFLARLRPYVGVHSGLAGIDPAHASPRLLDLLQSGLEGRTSTLTAFPELDAKLPLPRIFLTPSRGNVVVITATAYLETGHGFQREVVARIRPRSDSSLEILRWAKGTAVPRSIIANRKPPAC